MEMVVEMKFSLKKGGRYKASIVLGMFERAISNVTLTEELKKEGFSKVIVTGTGGIRYVVAFWDRADQDRELPRQVHEIVELKPVPEVVKIPPPPDVPFPEPVPTPNKPWWKVW